MMMGHHLAWYYSDGTITYDNPKGSFQFSTGFYEKGSPHIICNIEYIIHNIETITYNAYNILFRFYTIYTSVLYIYVMYIYICYIYICYI